MSVSGYILPEFFRFPGCESFQHGLAALNSIPVEGWAQLVGLIGAHESLDQVVEGGSRLDLLLIYIAYIYCFKYAAGNGLEPLSGSW